MNKIEENLSHEKLNFINGTCLEELQYWKKIALVNVSIVNERKQLKDLVPPTVFLTAIKNAKKMDIYEIILYLNLDNREQREQRTFIQDTPKREDVSSFKAISENLKTLSKSIKEDENMRLKNKYLFGGWISIAAKVYRHDKIIKKKNLPHRSED